jgi:hypothetical protein
MNLTRRSFRGEEHEDGSVAPTAEQVSTTLITIESGGLSYTYNDKQRSNRSYC